jgi:very-short-patch-repair endonuclease
VRLGIEVDGWAHHGQRKADFLRDRERDRQLVLHGWRLLRFAASEIRRNPWGVLEHVRQALGEQAPGERKGSSTPA